MNRVFGLCGKNVTFSNIFKSLGPTIATKPAILYKPIEASCRLFSQRLRTTRAPLNIDGAQITKDVIIYKYENPKYFKFMNVFALAQFAMFSTYSQFSALSLRSTPAPETNESQPWYMKFNMGDASFKYGLSIVCFVLGFVILYIIWTFTLRSVRVLILRKGGSDVSFVTYGPLGKNRIQTVPLRYVTGIVNRETNQSYLPLKVKNITWFFVLDKRGEYVRKDLFDHYVNLNRKF